MKIYLVNNTCIKKFTLPSDGEDFFTYDYKISGTNKSFLITFERENGVWKFKSNGIVNTIENMSTMVDITDYKCLPLKILGYNLPIYLYALPSKNEVIYNLSTLNLSQITVGSDANNMICYKNDLVASTHFVITKDEKGYLLNVSDKNLYLYVNKNRVMQTYLKAGDVIFLNGLKIIWMMNYIVINNPNNMVKVSNMGAYNSDVGEDLKYQQIDTEEQSIELYSEDDYFFHKPRIKEIVEPSNIKIDLPPQKDESEGMPWYITALSSVAMLGMTFSMSWNLYLNVESGKTWKNLLPQIVMVVTLVFASLLLPRILASYNKKVKIRKETERVTKYSKYLVDQEKKIEMDLRQKSQIMNDNYITSSQCRNISLQRDNRYFWCREISDEDFLKVRVGNGNITSPLKIEISEKAFSMSEDELVDRAYALADKYQKLNNVPVVLPLVEKNITAVVCDTNYLNPHKYFENLIIQLATLHSAADLKIVILTNDDNKHYWDNIKFLPHCFSEDKNLRFFSSGESETKELSDYLETIFKERRTILEGNKKQDSEEKLDLKKGYKLFDSYFLIITDSFKNNSKIGILEDLFKTDMNCGFSFIALTDNLKNVPAKCSTFLEIGSKSGCILDKNISSKNQQMFNVEIDNDIDMGLVSRSLLNVPLMTKEGIHVLPNSLSFLEMYGVSRIEQLNVLNRWKSNDPVTNLSAPIGVYASGEQFMLNLHEKNHGPHGLIAGSTGSGKSEFIITYILSMCINYHPYEVQFVLIDYKGGGLAGAFENRETGVRIPHLVGTITNLDTAEMNRTLVSIESELKRRQKKFNEVRDRLGESTIDIYKYQRLYREGSVSEPMAHLFIISDEFAELKAQQPDFMNQLISTARIGRSLGVHLILATQKPSGVVNDQIWSNSKFKVCLKVQDRGDSMEMLKKPDAASIKEAGRYYLQVGYDDFFDKGQSGWAGAKYVPSDKIIKKVDDSINFIDDNGTIIKSVRDISKVEVKTEDLGDQLTNIVKYINNIGSKEKIKTTKLWLDAIPDEIFVNNLKNKYKHQSTPYLINPIIGEYDNPSAQKQNILELDLTNDGNTLIIGKSGSGKENLITTILLSTITEHTPEEVNFYIVDCGTESLKIFNNVPHVGDIATVEEPDKIVGIFDMLYEELERRKDLLSDFGGSYVEYIKNSNEKLPLIVTIINNYEIFCETNSRFADSIINFYRDGSRYGLVFILSELSPTTLKARQMQNFPNKLCLQLANENDYRGQLDSPRGLFPAKYFGRGLCFLEEGTYEFQTAYYTAKSDINNFVRKAAETYNSAYKIKAKKIPTVPDVIYVDEFYDDLTDLSNVPIGYDVLKKEKLTYDFRINTFTPLVTNGMNEERMSFIYSLIRLMSKIPNTKVKVIDFVESYEKEIENVTCINNDFEKQFLNLNKEIISNKDENNNYVYFFLGIGMYKNLLSQGSKELLNNIFSNVNNKPNIKIILMDVLVSFKNIQVDAWYQANVDNSSGIWLAEDAANQLIINAPNITVEERDLKFPYVSFAISKCNHTVIKHMVDEEEDK